jgi:hypothetical protein
VRSSSGMSKPRGRHRQAGERPVTPRRTP